MRTLRRRIATTLALGVLLLVPTVAGCTSDSRRSGAGHGAGVPHRLGGGRRRGRRRRSPTTRQRRRLNSPRHATGCASSSADIEASPSPEDADDADAAERTIPYRATLSLASLGDWTYDGQVSLRRIQEQGETDGLAGDLESGRHPSPADARDPAVARARTADASRSTRPRGPPADGRTPGRLRRHRAAAPDRPHHRVRHAGRPARRRRRARSGAGGGGQAGRVRRRHHAARSRLRRGRQHSRWPRRRRHPGRHAHARTNRDIRPSGARLRGTRDRGGAGQRR